MKSLLERNLKYVIHFSARYIMYKTIFYRSLLSYRACLYELIKKSLFKLVSLCFCGDRYDPFSFSNRLRLINFFISNFNSGRTASSPDSIWQSFDIPSGNNGFRTARLIRRICCSSKNFETVYYCTNESGARICVTFIFSKTLCYKIYHEAQ